jgi:putative IMPACT (imprinted ancient) family translation regulator
LTGSGLGDAVVVVTRYFGGTKLGKGGLVRAYGDAVRSVLAILPRAERVPTHTIMLAMPYSFFERARILVNDYGGQILDESFAADVTLTARFAVERFDPFQSALAELSSGTLQAEIIESGDAIVPTGTFGDPDSDPSEAET